MPTFYRAKWKIGCQRALLNPPRNAALLQHVIAIYPGRCVWAVLDDVCRWAGRRCPRCDGHILSLIACEDLADGAELTVRPGHSWFTRFVAHEHEVTFDGGAHGASSTAGAAAVLWSRRGALLRNLLESVNPQPQRAAVGFRLCAMRNANP